MSLSKFVEEMIATTGPGMLWDGVRQYLSDQGVRQVSYHPSLPLNLDAPQRSGPHVFTWGISDVWVRRYRDQGYVHIDPIPELALRRGTPFWWRDMLQITDLNERQRLFLKDLASHGLGDGVAMGVYGPFLRNASVAMCFESGDGARDVVNVTELHVAMQAAHIRLCALTEQHNPTLRLLSPREREVLNQIALGRSNGVIAELMGLSRHTVDTLVRRLFVKLGVRDRTKAVLFGLASGAIQTGSVRGVTQLRD